MRFMPIALHHNDDSHTPLRKYAQKLCHRYSLFGTHAFLLCISCGLVSCQNILFVSAPLPIPIISFLWEFVNINFRKTGDTHEKIRFLLQFAGRTHRTDAH